MNYAGTYKSREDNGQFAKVILRNNVTLVLKEQHATTLASITVYFSLPSLETSGENELLVRLASQVLFPFDEPLPANPLAPIGGLSQRKVTPSSIEWTVTLPASNLSKVYPLIARGLTTSSFPDSVIDASLHRISGEILDHQTILDSRELFIMAGYPVAFQPPPAGTPELIQSLNTFVKQLARGHEITIAVVGDIDREQVIRRVADNFLSLPSGESPPAPISKPKETPHSFRYAQLPSSDGLAEVTLAFPTKTAPRATLKLLEALLTDGKMAVLQSELAYHRPIAIHLSADDIQMGSEQFFLIHCTTRAQDLDDAVVYLLSRLQSFSQSTLSDDEIFRAREQFALAWNLENRSPGVMSAQLAETEAHSTYTANNKVLADIQRVNGDETQHVASDLFNLDRALIIEHWPLGYPARSFTAQSYRDFLSLTLPRATRKIAKKVEQASADITLPKESRGPYLASLDRTQLKPQEWSRFSILRGPNVFVSEFHLTPLVTILALYPGGAMEESRAQAGLTELMTLSAIQSIKDKPHDELWFQLEILGATIKPIVQNDIFGYALIAPPSTASTAIDIFLQILTEPRFLTDDVTAAKSILLGRLPSRLEMPSAFSSDQLDGAFFEHSDLYTPLPDRIAVIQKLNEKAVAAWWNRLQGETPPTLLILGDTEGTEYVSPFARKMSSSKWKPSSLAQLSSIKTPKMPALTNGVCAGLESPMLTLGFPGPNFGTSKATSIEVARWLFKDLFTHTRIQEFHYLRMFEGDRTVPQGTPATEADQVMKQMAALISNDQALESARRSWRTHQELQQLDPVKKGLEFFRWSLFYPDIVSLNKAIDSSEQITGPELREGLKSVFIINNLMAAFVTPKPAATPATSSPVP